MSKNKSFTVKEATRKMESYCAYQERCHKEVELRLKEMNLIDLAKEVIILHLLEHDFLNEERFSKTFARGKFRIKKWGKQRIMRELRMKSISDYNIKSALKEIDDVEYYKTFNELAEKRLLELNETDVYKKRKKMADYLLYRGWETALVYKKITELIG
jgi:regulatory protein